MRLSRAIGRLLSYGVGLSLILGIVSSTAHISMAITQEPESGPWQTVRAGVAEVDITPPLGQYKLFASDKTATTLRDPLYAKVLVIQSANTRVALVSLDLIAPFAPELFDPYRLRLKSERQIDYVVLSASHTHNSPGTIYWPEEVSSMPWTKVAMDKIYDAILSANDHAVPVRIGIGEGTATIGSNRRLVTPQGVTMCGRDYPNKPIIQPFDPRVGVLRLDREDGSILAIIIHYACHPVTLMAGDATDFSADYVGEMEKNVAAQLPGRPAVLFLQGAAGDINLRDSIPGSGEPEVVRYGQEMARAVVDATQRITTEDQAELSYRSESLELPVRWSEKSLELISPNQRRFWPQLWFEHMYRPFYSIPVGSILLGRKLALSILPGEPFVDLQFQLDHQFSLTKAWLVGYSNLYIGYIPTIRAAAEGGYGANGAETILAIGAGTRLVDSSVIQLYDQWGWWHSVPGQLLGKAKPKAQ